MLNTRNFSVRVKKISGFIYDFIYYPKYVVEISDGENTIVIDETTGFQVITDIQFPKNIILKHYAK